MGGDSSANEFIVPSSITSFEAMRNQTLLVDYPSSAFALQAYDILQQQGGLSVEDYDVMPVGSTRQRYEVMTNTSSEITGASLLGLPFNLLATQQLNYTSLGRAVDLGGMYQSSCLFVTQTWLNQNEDIAVRFITAWIQSLRYVFDENNKNAVVEILQDRLQLLDNTTILEQTYDLLLEPGYGLEPDAAFLWEGFRNVLRIREEFEGGGPFVAEDFVNLTFYEEALRRLDGTNGTESDDDDDGASGGVMMMLDGRLNLVLVLVAVVALSILY